MFHRIALLSASLVALAPSSATAQDLVEFFSFGQSWKYLDNNVAPPSDWTEVDFDDSSWASGNAQLGFGDGDEAHVIQKGAPASTSFYFRHSFNVTASQLDELEGEDFDDYQLIFNLVRDDGAIVYVNGYGPYYWSNVVENSPGLHGTRAIGGVGGAAENTPIRTVLDAGNVLEVGENVIAVSVHQISTTSSDISFDLEFSAQRIASAFGVYHPPVGIRFEDAKVTRDFTPDPDAGEEDLGWEAVAIGGQPSGYGSRRSNVFDEPAGGFVNGYAFFTLDGTGRLQTQTSEEFDSPERYRIDLRNYTDVEVRFGIRVDDTDAPTSTAGFEPGDSVKYTHRTSVDGASFDRETITVLAGDNSGGGGISFESFPLVKEVDMKVGIVPDAAFDTAHGSSWRDIGFDDSGWHSFNLGLGYDSSKYLPYIGWNTQSVMKSINATCYMRIPFNVDDKTAFNTLKLYMRDDDGFVVYLNGDPEPIAQNFDPPSLAWDSSATGNRVETIAEPLTAYDVTDHLDKLVDGANVLAIHCLNSSKSSSDFLISAELEATLPNQVPRNDPPLSLNDLNFGVDGPLYYYTYPVADSVNSYTFEVDLTMDEFEEAIYFDNWEITGTPINVDGYDSWIELETNLEPGDSGDVLADPDGDGIVNILEFAFGSDPEVNAITTASGQSIMPVVDFVEEGGDVYYEISWRQRDAPATGAIDFPYGGYAVQGIRYIPQFSNNAVDWDDPSDDFQGEEIGEPTDNNDGTLTYRFRYQDRVLVDGDPEPFFGRLKIVPAPPTIEDGF